MRPFSTALFALALIAPRVVAGPPSGPTPEQMLSGTTQLYVRWDGIPAHSEAYKKSIWGGIMAGPTGDSVRTLIARGPKLLGSSVLAEPLLDGRPPAELKANLADLKAAEQVVELLADKGVIVAAEVREPGPSIKGIGQAFGGLVGGKVPGAEALIPDAQVLIVVPDVGPRAEVLFGTLRLLIKKEGAKIEPFGEKGFLIPAEGHGPVMGHAAWWVEEKHFVFYFGTRKPADVAAELKANIARGGITRHALYERCLKTGEFESVTRGFVDTGKMIGLAKSLAGPFVPGLKERLDSTGLAGVKAVVFSSGFDGKESRAVYELDVPGERKGLTRVLKNVPLAIADLPPMPPDVSRFSALRIDMNEAFDSGLGLIELLSLNHDYGVEDETVRKNPTALIAARKSYLKRETDKFLGISMTDDILPYLGDKIVVFQSPTEGLQVFGSVVCISIKDAAKVRTATERVQRALETIANSPIKVRKKMLKGVEYREFYASGFGIVTPTYAIVGDWLVVAGHPQAVQGAILRAAGSLEKWAPDAATTRRLAKMPAGACGLQYCDPKSSASNLCTIGPLILSTLGLRSQFTESENDFDPIDVSIVPNAHELARHLFPNLTVTRDDGKTIRIDVNESFSLPLEVVGAEPFGFAIILGLRF
jgi:hypothetical protein